MKIAGRGIDNFFFKHGVALKKLVPTFLDNITVYLWHLKPKRGPCYVNLAVSDKCNCRCVYCGRWKKEADTENPLLTGGEKLILIDQLAKSGVCFLSLYDKEPLLAGDLEILIRRAKKNRMGVNVSTNGLLLEEKAKALVDSGVDSIIISVESHMPEIHDKIRATPGCFGKIVNGIKLIKDLRGNKLRPYLSVRCLINKQTYEHLSDYIEYWEKIVDDIILKPISENKSISYSIPDQMRFSESDGGDFKPVFHRVLKNSPAFDNAYNRAIPLYFFEPNRLSKKYGCFAGFLFGNVDLSGNVYFCAEKAHKIGNIKQDDFLKIWSSQRAQEERKSLLFSRGCFCWLEFFQINIFLEKILFWR